MTWTASRTHHGQRPSRRTKSPDVRLQSKPVRWFDQSELRGGDVLDQTIRKQIKSCALFVPVISRHTHERREGYFRLEWKLAVDTSNLISATQAFLVPVVIDDTPEDDEEVPEKIRDIVRRTPVGYHRLASAEIEAQWGHAAAALHWLAAAERLRDPGLLFMKADWTLDPVRAQSQFRAIERRLNLPQ